MLKREKNAKEMDMLKVHSSKINSSTGLFLRYITLEIQKLK